MTMEPTAIIGRKVVDAKFADDAIHLTFPDGDEAVIWDDGQCCCESRWMTTDDDLTVLIGGTILAIETRDGPDADEDTEFLEIRSTTGFVTAVTHNDHNGYYGEFRVVVGTPAEYRRSM